MIQSFTTEFQRHWLAGMRSKLGPFTEEREDVALVETLLAWMHREHRDFTNNFRALSDGTLDEAGQKQDSEFQAWQTLWKARLARQPQTPAEVTERMRRHNP